MYSSELESRAFKNDIASLIDMALVYRYGLGVAPDSRKSFLFLKKAAELGDPQAQVAVGLSLIHGIGVHANPPVAEGVLQNSKHELAPEILRNMKRPIRSDASHHRAININAESSMQ